MVSSTARSAQNPITLDAAQATAMALATHIRAFDPELRIVYAVHRQGQLKNTLHALEDGFIDHPAGKIAATIANRSFPAHEPSSFHGLCARRSGGLAGFGKGSAYLAVISINVDQFLNFTTLLHSLYRQTWLALELTAFFRKQPSEKIPDRPLNVKRNPLSEARVNLRADLFAVFMMHEEGHDAHIPELIKSSACAVLTTNLDVAPEQHAFPMIAQTVQYALSEVVPDLSPKKTPLVRCSELATELAETVDDTQLKLWIRFAGMCQDMAWRGYRPETILGCAVHTSDDSFLRAVAHKVADYAQIKPQTIDQIRLYYNSFIGLQDNYPIHAALVEQAFETALADSLDQGSANPFFQTMRTQNNALTKGRFVGWCAAALASAGRVFREANTTGISQAQAARIEFEARCYLTALPALYELSNTIVDDLRAGQDITPERMVKLARAQGTVELVAHSFEYLLYNKDDTPPPPPHSAEEDLTLEHMDTHQIYERISQFTRLSDLAPPPQPEKTVKKEDQELSLEDN